MSPTLSEDGDAARMQFIKRPVLAVPANEMNQPYDGAVLPDEMSDLDDNEHVHDRLDAQQAHQGSFGALPSSWVGSFKRLVHGAASNSFVRRMQDTANQAAESFKSGYRRRTGGGGGGSKADAREDEKAGEQGASKAESRRQVAGGWCGKDGGEEEGEGRRTARALAQGATRRGREKSSTRHHVEPPVRSHGGAGSSSSSAKKEVPLIVPPPKRVYFVANAPPL